MSRRTKTKHRRPHELLKVFGSFVLLIILTTAYFNYTIINVSLQNPNPVEVSLLPYPKYVRQKDKGDVHIIFSTGCNLYQEWQSRTLIHSARKIANETARITRIVSGCDTVNTGAKRSVNSHPYGLPDRLVDPSEILKYASIYPDVFIHFTPSFQGSDSFPWMNKPLGILHWLQNSNHEGYEKIIILDPDMMFMRPFYKSLTGSPLISSVKNDDVICEVSCQNRHLRKKEKREEFADWVSKVTDQVSPGKAVAQTYGLSSQWSERIDFNKFFKGISSSKSYVSINGVDIPEDFKDAVILHIKKSEIRHFYSVGPPYIVHLQDLKKLLPLWKLFMKPSHDDNPGDILADMYAYSMAAMEINLPHLGFEHFMISNVKSIHEGWHWIDPYLNSKENEKIDDILQDSDDIPDCSHVIDDIRTSAILEKHSLLPHLIHTSQIYTVKRQGNQPHTPYGEEYFFHKGHVPANIFQCELPLLKYPPEDFIRKQQVKVNRRAAFLICAITDNINRAVLDWKEHSCPLGYNSSHHFRIGPMSPCRGRVEGKNCWQGASIK